MPGRGRGRFKGPEEKALWVPAQRWGAQRAPLDRVPLPGLPTGTCFSFDLPQWPLDRLWGRLLQENTK